MVLDLEIITVDHSENHKDPLEWLETQWYGCNSLYLGASGSSIRYRGRPPVPYLVEVHM